MVIPFIKMHGLGNDFVIVDGRESDVSFSPNQIIHLADRRRGIGFDQLCILKKPENSQADVAILIHNVDGTIVKTCGNLTRCVAKLIGEETGKTRIVIQTAAGLLKAIIQDGNTISVNMGQPSYQWQDIPLSRAVDTRALEFNFANLPPACLVSLGNPHCVFIVEDLKAYNIHDIGPFISTHPLFPEETNVEIARILDPEHLDIQIWERGIGYSVACGSGACAVASAASHKGLIKETCFVHMPGGELRIQLQENQEIMITGQVRKSFSGHIDLSLL